MNAKGTHLLIDLYGASHGTLNDAAAMEAIAREMAGRVGAQVLDTNRHTLSPQGVIVVLTLSQSHISIHTWPEDGYAAVDLFFCGRDDTEPPLGEWLCRRLRADRFEERIVLRGMETVETPVFMPRKEIDMKMIRGVYEKGIVRTVEDPHVSGRQEVVVLFPESGVAARPWIGVPASALAPLVGVVSLGGNALEDTEDLYNEPGDHHDSGR